MKRLLLLLTVLVFSAVPVRALDAADLLAAVNGERAQAGLGLLEADPTLDAMAGVWAGEAAAQKSLIHRKNLTELMKIQRWALLNENIYMGSGKVDAQRVVRAWMKSPGHRRNLMNTTLTHAGFGSAVNQDGETYVVFNGGTK